MTDDRRSDDLRAIQEAARTLVPELARRLNRHGLGELEVRDGRLRLRIASRAISTDDTDALGAEAGGSTDPEQRVRRREASDGGRAAGPDRGEHVARRHPLTSPAVGVFVYADGLGTGLDVTPGQHVGYVDMLGVRYDVRADRAGRVAGLVTESGDPVEYGQVLVELDEPAPA